MCPMWQIFEINDTADNMSLFSHHTITHDVDVETGLVIDPNGGLVSPLRLSYRDSNGDRELLRSMLPEIQYGDRHADAELAMDILQDQLNTANERYIQHQHSNGTPPSEHILSFVHPLLKHGQANATRVRSQLSKDFVSPAIVRFEWDSDASHHFIGTDKFILSGSFVKRRMIVQVADGQKCFTLSYGSLNHAMLHRVWYIESFQSYLFSDVQAMKEGFFCQCIGQKLEYFRGDKLVLTFQFEESRWYLTFELTESHTQCSNNHAHRTSMRLLPVSVQALLVHRRCNHVSPSLLYLAVYKNLTTSMCAEKFSSSLKNLSVIDCLACSLAKSKYADHKSRSAVLPQQGRERQNVPGHITPRGLHGGIATYELLALDLKTELTYLRLVVGAQFV